MPFDPDEFIRQGEAQARTPKPLPFDPSNPGGALLPKEPPPDQLVHGVGRSGYEHIAEAIHRQDPRYQPTPENIPDWARTAGEIGLSFAVPERFGLQVLANRAASMLPGAMRSIGVPLQGQATVMRAAVPAAHIGGAAMEGAAGGAIGGAISSPEEDDAAGNASTGAIAGGVARGSGSAYQEAMRVLPPRFHRTAQALAAGAATAGLHQMGVTSWMPQWAHAAVWWTLFQENLADLAAKWAQKRSGVVGSAAAHLMPSSADSGQTDLNAPAPIPGGYRQDLLEDQRGATTYGR